MGNKQTTKTNRSSQRGKSGQIIVVTTSVRVWTTQLSSCNNNLHFRSKQAVALGRFQCISSHDWPLSNGVNDESIVNLEFHPIPASYGSVLISASALINQTVEAGYACNCKVNTSTAPK